MTLSDLGLIKKRVGRDLTFGDIEDSFLEKCIAERRSFWGPLAMNRSGRRSQAFPAEGQITHNANFSAFRISHSFHRILRMEGDAEEIVEVRVEVPPDLYALVREGARKRGMAPEDFLSILVECDIKGIEPLWRRAEGS